MSILAKFIWKLKLKKGRSGAYRFEMNVPRDMALFIRLLTASNPDVKVRGGKIIFEITNRTKATEFIEFAKGAGVLK
jgi:hypothetical protein